MALDADLYLHLSEAEHPHAQDGQSELEPTRGGQDDAAVPHLFARLVQVWGQQLSDPGQRFAEVSAIGIEQSQLQGTAGCIAATLPLVFGNGGQLQTFQAGDRGGEGGARLTLCCKVAAAQQVDGRVDGFPGDVLARHSFAETFRLVLEPATEDEVLRGGARVGSVTNGPP